jgi:predicted ATPase/DNA-binding CsgD family transcriptional regulator
VEHELVPGTVTFVVTDGTTKAFENPADALAAAIELHERAASARTALHTGEGRRRADGRHDGPGVRGAERLREVANDGQILVSSIVASLVRAELPDGTELVDLGIHRMRDLSTPDRVFELRSFDAPEVRPLRSLDVFPNNLPIQLSSFVGRDRELAAVHALLSRERLVTLSGSGGCGKTRLAAQVAAAHIERWPDGVWWVELQSATAPATVAELVAGATGVLVEPVGGPLRSLTAQLRSHRALICIDNCEHLLDAVAELVESLMRSCPEVSILTTSREPLAVAGEAVSRVPPLVGGEAMELFVERARDAHPSFTVDHSNESTLQRVCSGLDGIPLAIELAAAWMRTLTPRQIEAGLDDRFSLLVRSARGAAARHQTLDASIDWSYELLEERDRAVFRRLAVFRGGFTLDAARSVCAGEETVSDDVLPELASLVDKSLVVVEERDGESRFRLLETIRQYANQRLDDAGDLAATRDRHLDHVLAVAESAEPELDRDKDAWCARLEPERDNLRTALNWGLAAEDPDRGRRLAAATAWLWNLHGRGKEGIEFLEQAIALVPRDRTILQARLLTGFAMIGDTTAPRDLDPVREGQAIAAELGDERLRGRCLTLIAVGTFYNDFDAGWQLCEEAIRCAELAGDEFGVDGALALQGLILHFRDRHDDARAVLEPVVDRLLRRGDRGIASTVLTYQSNSALYAGDMALARRLGEQAAQVADPLSDYHRVGTTRSQLALLRAVSGDIDGGLALLEGFLHVVEGAGPQVFVPGMARTLGLLHLWRGDLEEAEKWLSPDAPAAGELADTHLDALAMPALAETKRRLGDRHDAEHVLDRVEAIAHRLGMPRVLADTLDQRALLAEEEPDRASDLHHDALAIRVEHGLRTFYVDSLEALAILMARTNRQYESVRTFAVASEARDSIGYPRRPIDRPEHNATVAELRATLGDHAFGEAWAEGAPLVLDDAVTLVRRTRGQRGRPSTGWASLTPTEQEVVQLVVAGLSNPEISAKLFMSRGTVKTHLSHVFTKLGVGNRTELATLAAPRLAR